MTKKQQDKIQEYAKNCTTYDDMIFEDEVFSTFKDKFFNAVMGRVEMLYTQNDVSKILNISLRSVVELEKGKSTNITIVNNYIEIFKYNFSQKRKVNRRKYIVV